MVFEQTAQMGAGGVEQAIQCGIAVAVAQGAGVAQLQ